MKNKALVVLSGGQDSVTCVGLARFRKYNVHAISFNYGQRHRIELACAASLCQAYEIPHKIVDIPLTDVVTTALSGDSKVDPATPHPHREGLPASFVPNRNAVMLSLAHAWAQEIDCDLVYTGTCQTDYSGYPDCRREFIDALEKALNLGSKASVSFVTPMMYIDKAATFQLAEDVGFLREVIHHSHTCYLGTHDVLHEWGYGCGNCPACVIRRNGFQKYMERRAK